MHKKYSNIIIKTHIMFSSNNNNDDNKSSNLARALSEVEERGREDNSVLRRAAIPDA